MAYLIDPAIQPNTIPIPRHAVQPPEPILAAAEIAQSIRLQSRPAAPAQSPFAGSIEDMEVPVRWGSIPARCYRPAIEGQLPAVAFFHGGGFILGSLDTHDQLCREIATASGALVVSIAYRLAPEAPFPAGLEDAYDATVWLASMAEQLGADPQRIAVAGDSAGANLAAGVALLAKQHGGPALLFQLLFYPKLDFVHEYPSHAENRELGIPREVSRVFDDCYLPDRAQYLHPLASLVLATDLAGLPPGLIVTADADTLRDEAETYGHMLRKAGVEFATLRAIGQVHGFATMTDQVPSARLITHAALALMGQRLRRHA